jgi:hypothetical protein
MHKWLWPPTWTISFSCFLASQVTCTQEGLTGGFPYEDEVAHLSVAYRLYLDNILRSKGGL